MGASCRRHQMNHGALVQPFRGSVESVCTPSCTRGRCESEQHKSGPTRRAAGTARGPVLLSGCARSGVMALGMATFLAISTGLLHGQKVLEAKAFKIAEYYDPPNETQMKSLLEFGKGVPQEGGRNLLTDARLQTFLKNGQREITVEAPQCVHDPNQHSINSPGTLHVKTGDGKFSIEGEGFLWLQTNSILFISNRVHTVVHPESGKTPRSNTATNVSADFANAFDVFSDRFYYEGNPPKGIYSGNVRVAGTNLALASGVLTIEMPRSEGPTPSGLRDIIAEQDVSIDYEAVHATGQRAVYSADTGRVEITGHPTWRAQEREGSGEELIIDRTNQVFRVNRQAYLKMPSRSMGASGFLPRPASTNTHSLAATNEFVEVRSDNYELRTNSAVFRNEVQLSEKAGEQLKGKMSCGLLTVMLSGTNQMREMVAEEKVVIEQEDKQFTSAKARYTGTNGMMELTGNPAWRSGTREGKGDVLLVNVPRDEMVVRGNASMRLPASELGHSAMIGLGKTGTTNSWERGREGAVTGGARPLPPEGGVPFSTNSARLTTSSPRFLPGSILSILSPLSSKTTCLSTIPKCNGLAENCQCGCRPAVDKSTVLSQKTK